MGEFYFASLKNEAGRVVIVEVDNPDSKYQEFKKFSHGKGAQAKIRELEWMKGHFENLGKVNFHWASAGTRFVTEAFMKKTKNPDEAALIKLRNRWSGDLVGIETFLFFQGFEPGCSYVLLWCKKGGRHAAKAHHFTSLHTWRLLAERIKAETKFVPVAVGEDIGLKTVPSLTTFWEDTIWQSYNLEREPRTAQLGLFSYLAQHYTVRSVGMISGALEGPAMLGIPTMYLEERTTARLDRFKLWSKALPHFCHYHLQAPPGFHQQLYWSQYVENPDKPTQDKFGKVSSLVAGVDKQYLREKKRTRDPIEAMNQVIETIKSAELTLSDVSMTNKELDDIINWINVPLPHANVS